MGFQDMRISTRLAASFGLLVALLVGTTAVTSVSISGINADVAEIIDDRAVKVALATDLDQSVTLQARYLRDALIGHRDPDLVRSALDKVAAAAAANGATRDKLEKAINTQTGRALFQAVLDTRGPYAKERDTVVQLLRDGKPDEAGAHLLKALRPAQDAYLQAIDAFALATGKLMVEAGESAKARGTQAVRTALAVAGLAVLLAIGVAVAITRSLVRQLGGEPADAMAMASAIAGGDLTRSVPLRAGDSTSLMARLDAMQASLRQVVGSVRANAEGVASASSQIAQGNQDLSGRTEEQASALQQTAATMEELGTTVRHNADKRPAGQPAGAHRVGSGRAGWRRGGPGRQHHAGHQRQQPPDRRHHRHHRRHRLPDQHPGAERGSGSGACGVSRAAASRWWPARCAAWPSAAPKRRARSSA